MMVVGQNLGGHLLLSAMLCLDGVLATNGGQRCWMTKTKIFSDEVETAFSCPQPGDPDHFTNCCSPSWHRMCCPAPNGDRFNQFELEALHDPALRIALTEQPAELIDLSGRDGCPAHQPFGSCELPKSIGSCGYGQECCCGKCHPKLIVRCRDNGFWGSPFFHDACLQGCPTQPTLPPSPTTVLPDPAFVDFSEIADLLVPLGDLQTLLPTPTLLTTEDPEQREGAESGELSGRDGCPANMPTGGHCKLPKTIGSCGYGQECCCGECHPVLMVNCTDDGFWGSFYFNDACFGRACPSDQRGSSNSDQDCDTLEQRITELDREKTRLEAQRGSCSSSSSSSPSSSSSSYSQQPDLVWATGRTTDNVKG